MEREPMVTSVACLVIVVISIGVAGWTLFTGQIQRQGIDALFLILVCLLAAAAFAPIPVQALRQGLLGGLLNRRPAKPSPSPSQRAEAREDH